MAEIPLDERQFTEDEVQEILKQAAESGPSDQLAGKQGLSLAELRVIASEVGIDPAELEQAARTVAKKDRPRKHGILGAPTVLRVEREAKGTLDQTRAAEIVSVIRRTMGQKGVVSDVAGSLEWSANQGTGDCFVSVSSRDDTIAIEGSANLTSKARTIYGVGAATAVSTATLGIILDEASLIGLVVAGAFVIASHLGLRAIVRKLFRDKSAKLRLVVDEVAQLTEQTDDPVADGERAT